MARVLPRAIGLAAAAAALALAPAARAGVGNGIRFGDGRMHLYLTVEPRYDSNVSLDPSGQAIGDVAVHLRPGLTFEADGDLLDVRFDGAIDFVQYLGVESADTTDLSRIDATAALGLGLNREGVLGLELEDRLTRSDQTQSLAIPTAAISIANVLDLTVPWRPGGGALVASAGGRWIVESFEPYLEGFVCDPATDPACDTALYSQLGYNEVQLFGEGRWKFLPRTSAVLRATWLERIPNDETVALPGSGLKILGGLTGLVTSRFAATIEGGWGDTFDSVGVPYSTWLANVEAEWIPNETVRGTIGYSHGYDFDPGIATALYGSDRAWVEAHALLGRLTLGLVGRWDRLEYVLSDSTTQVVQVTPTAEMEAARWIRLGLGYRFTTRSSAGSLADLPAWEYTKNEVWLSIRLVY
jgi:hypothetical protein